MDYWLSTFHLREAQSSTRLAIAGREGSLIGKLRTFRAVKYPTAISQITPDRCKING
jgi:hypothetical protein